MNIGRTGVTTMKNKIIVFFVCLFITNVNSFAKDTKDHRLNKKSDQKELGLIDILDLALESNPKIKEAWLNIDISKYNYTSQLSNAFPTIEGQLSYSNNRNKYDDAKVSFSKTDSLTPSVNLSYLLFDFGGRAADIMNFKYKLNSVKYETNSYIQTFMYKVIQSYYELFSSLANEKASKETENSSYEAFKAAKVRYDIGLAPLTDKLQAETAYTQKRLIREKIENEVLIKKANLNYMLNLHPASDLNLAIPFTSIPKNSFQENVVDLIEAAVKNRPDLKAIHETKSAKKAEVYSAATDWLPSVNLNASYGVTRDRRKGGNDDRNNYNVGVTATMPFFTGGYIYSNVAKTKTQLNIINEQIKDLEKNIELDVWTAYQDFLTAKRIYITSETLLKSAKETEKTMLGRYKNGKASMLDLLNAQSDLAGARYEYISSQHNWFITRANLIRALGQMSTEELQSLNDAGYNGKI